jgi:hypothetical protein
MSQMIRRKGEGGQVGTEADQEEAGKRSKSWRAIQMTGSASDRVGKELPLKWIAVK